MDTSLDDSAWVYSDDNEEDNLSPKEAPLISSSNVSPDRYIPASCNVR